MAPAQISPLMGWFAVAVLVLSTGAFFAVTEAKAESESRPAVLLLWICAYLVCGFSLADGVLRKRLRVIVPPALVIFVALAVLSVTWSVAPVVTLRRSFGLIGTVLVGLFLAQRMRPLDVLEAVRRAVLVVAIASLLLYLTGDPRAFDVVHRTLRGVVATKNTLGRLMAIGLVAAVSVAFLDRSRVRRCATSAVPMVVAIALAESGGGAVTAGFALLLAAGVWLWGTSNGRALLVGAAAPVVGAITLLLPGVTNDSVLSLVGRDATITGRTEIWEQSVDAAAKRPLLGYGYGAFWHPNGAEAAARISARLYFTVPHAHNGILDMVLALGLVGAAVALVLVAGLFARGFRDMKAGRRQCAVLRLSVAVVLVLSNLVESYMLLENSLLTIVLSAALVVKEPQTESRRKRFSSEVS